MLASTAPYLAVMDGDMQHDEAVLPRMLEAAKTNHADVVVGSRHAEGGGMGSFAKERVWLSNLGRRLSRAVCSHDLSDPMNRWAYDPPVICLVFHRRYFGVLLHLLVLWPFIGSVP
jgi:Glycosyl transferase family 2